MSAGLDRAFCAVHHERKTAPDRAPGPESAVGALMGTARRTDSGEQAHLSPVPPRSSRVPAVNPPTPPQGAAAQDAVDQITATAAFGRSWRPSASGSRLRHCGRPAPRGAGWCLRDRAG